MSRRRLAGWRALRLAAILVAAVATGVSAGDRPAEAAADATPTALSGVTSEVLGRGVPNEMPGFELAAGRVTIAPGAAIPTHEHPGTQIAVIVSGELTYTVLTGEVPVTRAGGGGAMATPEAIVAGQTVVLRPGDSIVEQPGVIHRARNAGTDSVVILRSTLFPAGAPRTMSVEATPTS